MSPRGLVLRIVCVGPCKEVAYEVSAVSQTSRA